uniref:Radical SAM additional 4Fe4S-binding SPASM domain-containing protein n=1 Tax=Candidatus Kentrum sp. TC TaxID=2126339 RepID=A0A450YPX5_9GAMM|nr:MAG: radical SAM additional 4Fe4S-binding SPASM domain-containing protein [Candidatus Kentron sp. TC]
MSENRKILEKTHKKDNDIDWFVPVEDIFMLPADNEWLIYAPLMNKIFRMNNSVFEERMESVANKDSFYHEISKHPSLDIAEDDNEHARPSLHPLGLGVTLSPTTGCYLGCVYCCVSSNETVVHMDEEIASRALTIAANNYKKAGIETFHVKFHGQGEPSLNWKIIEYSTDFATRLAKDLNLKPSFAMVTSGVFSDSKLEYLVRNKFYLEISLDGVGPVNDKQRMFRHGGSVFEKVFSTIERLDERGMAYMIRYTASSENVAHIPAFVAFMADNTNCKHIQIEPLTNDAGRAITASTSGPEPAAFLRYLIEGRNAGEEKGISVHSPMMMDDFKRNSFCGAYGEEHLNFIVASDGLISSCVEGLDRNDPRSRFFSYGEYDRETKEFIFKAEQADRLREISVHKIEDCKDCFAKWHCAGNCLARGWVETSTKFKLDTGRCYITRYFAREKLLSLGVDATSKRTGR